MNYNTLVYRKSLSLEVRGKLSGLRAAVKDNIAVAGMPMTCASKSLKGFEPGFNAFAVERIIKEGGEIIGKTNLDEFAMGSSTEYSIFGPTRNPHIPDLTAGGSSGGSAASVALGECDFALGSDSGGSVRIPASFCQVVGFKPSYGRISRHGLTAFAPSFGHVGILARDIEIVRRVFSVVSGVDKRDSTNLNASFHKKGCMIAHVQYDATPFAQRQSRSINTLLSDGGHTAEIISFDLWDYVVPVYQILSSAQMSSCLSRYDGIHFGNRFVPERGEGFGDEVKRRLITGGYVLSRGYGRKLYQRAVHLRRLITFRMKQIFSEYDFLALPTSPVPPFKLGVLEPCDLYKLDILTALANMGGFPAISIPLEGFESLQLIGDYGRDEDLIDLAQSLG